MPSLIRNVINSVLFIRQRFIRYPKGKFVVMPSPGILLTLRTGVSDIILVKVVDGRQTVNPAITMPELRLAMLTGGLFRIGARFYRVRKLATALPII